MCRRITIAILAVLATLWSGLTAQTLTVANGNNATDRYIPIYGYYMDAPQKSHVLYPAGMLSSISGTYITGLTYYFSTSPSGAWGGTQMVRMGITTSSNLQNGYDSATVTTVWTGTLSSHISGNTLSITLDEPFLYSGGNLLIEVENPTGVAWKDAYFAGESQNDQLSYMTYTYGSTTTPHGAAFLPQTTFAYEVGCLTPRHATVGDVSDESALLSWAAPQFTPVASYTVAYKKNYDTAFTEVTVTDTFLTLTGLQLATTYEWRVRANCGSDGSSNWNNGGTFTTDIAIAHVPYYCGFEDEPERNCWQFVNGTGVNKWCFGTAVHTEGNAALYISNDNGEHNHMSSGGFSVWAYRDIYIDSTLNDVILSFDYRNANVSANSAKVFIGVPATPSGNTTPQNAIQLGGSLSTSVMEWKTANLLIDSTQRGLRRLYFLFNHSSSSYNSDNRPFAIDNLSIVSTHCASPYALKVASMDSTSALLTWRQPLAGNPGSYTLAYKEEDALDFTMISVTDTFLILNGLQYSTPYVWKVRGHCSPTELSDWSAEKSFLSAPIIPPLPYCCNFEDAIENAHWRFISIDSNVQWVVGQAVNNGDASSMYISWDNGLTNTSSHPNEYLAYALAYHDVYFPPSSSEYMISMDVKMSDCDYTSLTLWAGEPTTDMSIINYDGRPTGAKAVRYFNNYPTDTLWQHYDLIVDSTFAGLQRLYFQWYEYGTSYSCNGTAAVDNFCVSATNCGRPSALNLLTVTDTLAELIWQPFNNQTADSYTVAYRKESDAVFTEVVVTDTPCIISGLQPNTSYVWKVRANCSGSESSYWSNEGYFYTEQLHVELPYFCDFEDSVENSNWLLGYEWDLNRACIGNAVAYSGEKSLYITDDGGLTNSYTSHQGEPVVSRDIYFTPGFSKYQIDFDCKGGGDMQGYMRVLLGSNAVSGYLSEAPFWTHHSITVDSTYAGLQQLRIEFTFYTSLNPAGAIDNISIKGINHTIPGQLSTTDITSHSARLTWQSDTIEMPQAYLLAYRAEEDSTYTETLLSASDTVFQFSNLAASSWYVWKLKALYANNEWSEWSSEKAFKTLASIPYFCDFEDSTENKNWTIRNGENCEINNYGGGSFNYDYQNRWFIGTLANVTDNTLLYISSDDGVSNTYDMQRYSFVWAYRDIYLEPGYAQYQLSLDFKGVGQDGQDYVKLFLDTPATPPVEYYNVTIPFTQIGEDLNLTDQWVHKSFTVDSTHAGAQRLYILWNNNSNSGTNPPAAIDNISINVSTCGVPSNLIAAVQDTTAILTWSPVNLGTPSSYTLSYKKLTDSAFVELSVQDTVQALSGLAPKTTYIWKVRSNCSENEQSEWSGDMFFSTTQILGQLPYVCAYDSLAENNQWTMVNGETENQWAIGNATGFGDNHALYISNDGGTTNAYTITETSSVWAYRDILFENGHSEYQLSFDYKGVGQNNNDYMKVFVGSPAVPSGNATPAGAVQLGTTLSSVNDWAHYAFTLDSSYAGIQRIYFLWVNNNTAGVQPPAAIDNLTVVGSDCAIPSDLALTDMTDQTVTLAWAPAPGNPASYSVSVRQAGNTATTEYTTTDTFLTVTGLTPSAAYFCKVRTNRSSSNHSEWSSDLRVQMPANIPYLCDFENANERNAWQTVNGNYINQWYIGNAVNNGGDYSLYISNDGGVSYAFSQGYSNAYYSYVWAYRDIYFDPSDSVYTLSFDIRGAGGSSYQYAAYTDVYIGTPAIPNGSAVPDGLTTLETGLCGMSAWTTKTYTLDHSHAGLQRLYFFWRNIGYNAANPPTAIDNITIDGTPCSHVPSDLATQVMDTLANLSWTLPGGSAESYTVGYKLQYDTTFTYLTVQDEHVIIGNLSPLTTYVWKVRANCTATDHSFWSAEASFQTPENTARVPYICDFEDATENSHWQFFNGSHTNKWYIDSAVNNGGTHSLYISNDNGTTNAYTVNSSSRVWACRDIYFDTQHSQFLISFDFKGLGENYNNRAYDFAKLFIGPAVTPNTSWNSTTVSPSGSTQIGTYLYQQNDWTTIQDTLNLVSETGLQRIYFLWENDGSYGDNPPVAIDNFSIVPFGCGKPLNPVTSALSNHSATLSWEGTTSDFEVAYKLVSDSDYTIILTNEQSVTIEDLISDSEYEWKVRTICSDSSESEWSAPVFFTTYQNIAHLPYICDFENDYENSNWAVVSGNTNQWTIGDAVSNGGAHSLYVTADSGATNSYTHNSTYSIWAYRDIYFDEGFAEYELEFDYKGIGNSNHYGNVYIGNPATPHPESNIAPTGAIPVVQNIYNKPDWTHYSITLDATHAGPQRLYFVWTVDNTGTTASNPPAAIDNVAITAHNCVKPLNLQTANVTSSTASVSWIHASGNNFVVAYSVAGSSIYEEVQADQNSLILTDLLSSTTYVWKVKAVCGSSEESAWSEEQTFTTDYSIAQLPYINGFEDEYENNQWRYFYQSTNPTQWTFGNATNNGGSNALYISIDGGVTNTYSGGYYNSWAWRDIYIDSATTQIQISFDYKGVGYAHPYGSDYGRLLFGVPTTPYYVNNDGVTDLTGELKLIPNWTHYQYVVDVSNITGVRRIYLHWHTENSQGSNPPAAFDNLTIVSGDCGLPTDLMVDNVTPSSISFHFTPSSETDVEWQVAIVPEGTEITEDQLVNISDTFYTFTGLHHSSLYKIYVRNVCDEDAFWNYISQYTECGSISSLPFMENFDVNTTPYNLNLEFPRCWSRNESNVQLDNTFNISSLKFRGSNLIAVLPEVDSAIAVTDLQISFTMQYFNNSPSRILVGVMNDPNDTTTFTPIAEVASSPAQAWTYRHVPLNSYQGSGKYIALKSLNYTYIDNLVLDYISGCPFPTYVTASEVTNNSIHLTWTPNGDETEWQVIVVEQASDTATATPQTTTSTSYTYNGLQPSTTYVAYVRAVCGDGGFSTWEKTDPFTTVCDPVSEFPIVENFDEFPTPSVYTFELPRPECWTFPELYGQNYPGVDFYESYSGSNSLKFIAGAGNSYASYTIHATAVSPMLDADIHQLSVRFMLKSNWLYYPEGMEVGVMSDPYDMNTFESVALIIPQTSDEWYEFVVEFDSTQLSGHGNYIAFRYTSTFNQRFNWIDDIVIDYSSHVVIPPAPTNLVATNVTESTADLSWDQESSQVSGWIVEYRKAEESEWLLLFVDNMSSHLSGLEPDKQYVARVAAYFGDKFSEYSNECTFVTEGVGISDYALEDKVSVYPNPAHNYVVIGYEEGAHISRYALYSNDGKLLHQATVENLPVQVPVENLANGIYFLEIVCDEGVITKKIVKK